jgi:hypothetical protein
VSILTYLYEHTKNKEKKVWTTYRIGNMKFRDEVEFEEHPNRGLASLTVREGKVIETVTVGMRDNRLEFRRKSILPPSSPTPVQPSLCLILLTTANSHQVINLYYCIRIRICI